MSEDEEFERALALSLRDAHAPTKSSKPISVDSDSEDEDAAFQVELQRAIEESKQFSSTSSAPTPASTSAATSAAASGSGFLSERAQLEKARIERLKRMRRGAGIADENKGEDDEDEDERPAKRQHISSSSTSYGVRANGVSSNSTVASSSNGNGTCTRDGGARQIFWDGEVRQTACQYSEPRKDGRPTFRLTEILGEKSDLAFAVLSSYSLDLAWIYQFFDPAVPVIMIGTPPPGSDGEANMKYAFPNWIYATPYMRGGRGCMHMKFMLLFYKTGHLRIVISTANLIAYDWRDIENTLWVQDVPRRATPIASANAKAGAKAGAKAEDFASVLVRVLGALPVGRALELIKRDHPKIPLTDLASLRSSYDFTKVRVQLVPTIAGKHEGWPAVLESGHTKLMKAVRAIGAWRGRGKGKELVLECQGSSIGQYSTQWMNEFYHSARGESAEDWLDDPKSKRSKLPYPPVKVVFPSVGTVRASAMGERGGGTIFCSKRQWDAAKFPRGLFVDSKSRGGGSLMHSKMIIATFRESSQASFDHGSGSDTEDEDDEVEIVEDLGWAYVGSHNFTPSAWGNLSGSAFNPILNNVNFELGVVFILRDEAAVQKLACFERPARRYAKGERPWMQEESSVFSGLGL